MPPAKQSFIQNLSQGLQNAGSNLAKYGLSGSVTYQRPQGQPVAPGVQSVAPQVGSNSVPSSQAVKLPTGGYVRTVPVAWQPLIKQAYAANPNVPKGLIEATLNQESAMGSIPSSYNPKIGESAWIGGLTNDAKARLAASGQTPDFNSQKGVINGVAGYLNTIAQVHDKTGQVASTITDPYQLYAGRYKTSSGLPLSQSQKAQFINSVKYYADNYNHSNGSPELAYKNN